MCQVLFPMLITPFHIYEETEAPRGDLLKSPSAPVYVKDLSTLLFKDFGQVQVPPTRFLGSVHTGQCRSCYDGRVWVFFGRRDIFWNSEGRWLAQDSLKEVSNSYARE